MNMSIIINTHKLESDYERFIGIMSEMKHDF